MSVVGLFAGTGGFELAFQRAGIGTAMLVDKDPAAQSVLRTRFPGVPVRGDVLELQSLPTGTTIVTAGFPCQNLSMAGDKTGIHGTKSGVVERMLDLIADADVPTVVLENVYFMLHLEGGNAMRWLVEQFEGLGYHWAYRVLNTFGFGLPQRRRRVYFVASRTLDPRTVLFADDSDPLAQPAPDIEKLPLGFYWTEGRSGVGFTVDGIPPLKVGSAIGIPSAPAVLFPDGEVLTPSLPACEQLQGFEAGWTDVFPDRRETRHRWRLIGNAVSVPVAEWVAGRLKSPGPVLDFKCEPLSSDNWWPAAAWSVGQHRIGVGAGDQPQEYSRGTIANFRDAGWSRLSERALDGFIRRAEAGNLRMPDGFLDALRKAPRRSPRTTPQTG